MVWCPNYGQNALLITAWKLRKIYLNFWNANTFSLIKDIKTNAKTTQYLLRRLKRIYFIANRRKQNILFAAQKNYSGKERNYCAEKDYEQNYQRIIWVVFFATQKLLQWKRKENYCAEKDYKKYYQQIIWNEQTTALKKKGKRFWLLWTKMEFYPGS